MLAILDIGLFLDCLNILFNKTKKGNDKRYWNHSIHDKRGFLSLFCNDFIKIKNAFLINELGKMFRLTFCAN